MKYLIDIGHPAHVHNYKNLAKVLISKGNKVLFTTRDKEVAHNLLNHYGFEYISFGKPYKTKIGKIWGLLTFTLRLLVIAIKFNPDMYLNATMYSAFVAWILRKPHISMEDTGNMEQISLYSPFTSVILTPMAFHKELGGKHLRYSGFHELLYLHPNQFIPDCKIINRLGLMPSEKYILFRLVSWNASHDTGQSGISPEDLVSIIDKVSHQYRVFISSEGNLPQELEKYKFSLPPAEMHNVLAYASLFIGEGATMASECAMLGTPAIYINTMQAGTINEQEKMGLLFHFTNSENVLKKAIELLNTPDLDSEFHSRRNSMLKEMIDVTAFLIWFVENWPESKQKMKENPDYQYNFK